MRIPALALLLPMLAGCAATPHVNPALQARCESEVNADPEIRNLTLKYAGASTGAEQTMFDPMPLRRAMMKACLQGYPPTGGVEPVKHPGYTFDLF